MEQLSTVRQSAVLDGIAFVQSLKHEALQHRSVRHPFLSRLATGDMPDPRTAVVDLCYQYWGYSSWFQRYLLGTISQSESNVHRSLLLANLREETGTLSSADEDNLRACNIRPEWVRGVAHPELYRRFLEALGNGNLQEVDNNLRETALVWRDLMWRVCSQSGFATAVGALGLGTECIVRAVYEPWTQAIRSHLEVSDQQRVFFDLHTQIDDEHGEVFESISADIATSSEGRRALRLGMHSALYLRGAFFDAMWVHNSNSSTPEAA